MGEQFAWFFDVLIIGILLICMYNGSKRGFIKSVIIILSFAVAFLGAYFGSKAVAPTVYDSFAKDKIEQIFIDNIDNINIKSAIKGAIKNQNLDIEISDEQIDSIIATGGNLNENFQNFVKNENEDIPSSQLEDKSKNIFSAETVLGSMKGKIPENIYDEFEKFISKSETTLTQTIVALNNPSKEEGAKQLAEIAKPLGILVIEIILFFVMFAILMLIMRILANIVTKTIKFIPLVGSLNSFLGLILGLLQGALIVLLISFALKGIIAMTDNELIMLNSATISQTHILDLIYNLKIFK